MSGGMQGGGGVPDDLLTTKGDTHGFSDVNARIPVGSNNQTILADSAEALGVKYAPSSTSTLTTTGDLLGASSANVLTRIGAGASGEILTGNGAGVLPTFQASASGGLWEQAYTDSWTSAQTIDTGTVTFKKYISMWIAISGTSNVNYKWEALFNNDSSAGDYNSRYMQNANAGTRMQQNDLNLVEIGGTSYTGVQAYCQVNIINNDSMSKMGLAQSCSYTDGQSSGGVFNRSSVWFQWTNNALLTQIEIDPDTFGAGETFSAGEIHIFHTNG